MSQEERVVEAAQVSDTRGCHHGAPALKPSRELSRPESRIGGVRPHWWPLKYQATNLSYHMTNGRVLRR